VKKLIFLAGSTRKASTNRILAKAAHSIATRLDCEARFIDLADYDMPLYNGDYEEEHSLPKAAIELKQHFVDCDGFLIASPEYNSSFSPVLKNSLDWISRRHQENEPGLAAFKGKVAALTAASPGGYGGLRGLVPLRMMLSSVGVTVVPNQLAVGSIYGKIEEGVLTDQDTLESLEGVVQALLNTQVP